MIVVVGCQCRLSLRIASVGWCRLSVHFVGPGWHCHCGLLVLFSVCLFGASVEEIWQYGVLCGDCWCSLVVPFAVVEF